MLEGDTTPALPVDKGGKSPRKGASVAPKRRSIFEDPLVRNLGLVAAGLVILYLVLIIGALVSGVIGQGRPIQTAAERDLRLYEKMIQQGSRNEQVWANYVNALIRTKQYGKAQQTIDQANRAGIVDPRNRYLDIMQVTLSIERKDYDKAVKAADKGMAALKKQYDKDWEDYKKSGKPTSMTATGLGRNYYDLLYGKAKALQALKQPKKAIEALNEYLKENNTAADVIEFRGDLQVDAGNKKKAVADYKSARVFMDDTSAIDAKIKELGAAK